MSDPEDAAAQPSTAGDIVDEDATANDKALELDLFGGADSSTDDEFQGFEAALDPIPEQRIARIAPAKKTKEKKKRQPKKRERVQNDDDDDDLRDGDQQAQSYYDQKLAEIKASKKRISRSRDEDISRDTDDKVAQLLRRMQDAVAQDHESNAEEKPALNVLKFAPVAFKALKKKGLHESFIAHGALEVLRDWLSPLPDRSLPHLSVREGVMTVLLTMEIDIDSLKSSNGLGKAVFRLRQHPKETLALKKICKTLIDRWSRPVLGKANDYVEYEMDDRVRDGREAMKSLTKIKATDVTHGVGSQSSQLSRRKQQEEKPEVAIKRARVPKRKHMNIVVAPTDALPSSFDPDAAKIGMTEKARKLKHVKEKMKASIGSKQAERMSIVGRGLHK